MYMFVYRILATTPIIYVFTYIYTSDVNLCYIVRLISPNGCKVCMYCGSSFKKKFFDGKLIVVTLRGRCAIMWFFSI